jgi:hypothetical protein
VRTLAYPIQQPLWLQVCSVLRIKQSAGFCRNSWLQLSVEFKGINQSEPEFVNVEEAQESIPPAYEVWRLGTITLFVVPARQAT